MMSKTLLKCALFYVLINVFCTASKIESDAKAASSTCPKIHCVNKCRRQHSPNEYRIKLEENSCYLVTRLNEATGETFLFADEKHKMKAETFWPYKNDDSTYSFMALSLDTLALYVTANPSLNGSPLMLTLDSENSSSNSQAVKMELIPAYIEEDDPRGERVVAIRSKSSGRYWRGARRRNEGRQILADGSTVKNDAKELRFVLEPVNSSRSLGQFYLRSNDSNGNFDIFASSLQYISRKNGILKNNISEPAAISFELLLNDDETYSFRLLVDENGIKSTDDKENAQFLVADSTPQFVSYRSVSAPFRRFQLVHRTLGYFSLRSVATGRYLSAIINNNNNSNNKIVGFIAEKLEDAILVRFVSVSKSMPTLIAKNNDDNVSNAQKKDQNTEEKVKTTIKRKNDKEADNDSPSNSELPQQKPSPKKTNDSEKFHSFFSYMLNDIFYEWKFQWIIMFPILFLIAVMLRKPYIAFWENLCEKKWSQFKLVEKFFSFCLTPFFVITFAGFVSFIIFVFLAILALWLGGIWLLKHGLEYCFNILLDFCL